MGGKASTNCSAFIAGIIEGVLCSTKLYAKVSAHLYNENAEDEGERRPTVTSANPTPEETKAGDGSNTTIYVIKFAKEVTAREKSSN